MKKVSISHVNQAFNVELQIDFLFPVIRGSKHTIMNMSDTGTNYSELVKCDSRDAQTVIYTIETFWIYRHGAPDAISADDKFNCESLRQFMRVHDIQFKPRPTRLA